MPHSVRENNQDVLDFVAQYHITNVLDIGPGAGTYSNILRDQVTYMDAIEVWAPYVKQFNLEDKYDDVMVGDVRDIAWSGQVHNHSYDLVIFGDVLEHMTEDQAAEVWGWASQIADWGLISVPIGHWPQGAVDGNPFEEHVQPHLEWPQIVEQYGPFDHMHIYEQTATFIRRFQ